MTSSTQNLLNIAADLNADGKEVKIIRLRTSHGSKANRYADRIRGGSSRVRTHGGAAGSRGTTMTTKASALADLG
jgi:hypothetical protein